MEKISALERRKNNLQKYMEIINLKMKTATSECGKVSSERNSLKSKIKIFGEYILRRSEKIDFICEMNVDTIIELVDKKINELSIK